MIIASGGTPLSRQSAATARTARCSSPNSGDVSHGSTARTQRIRR
jgi:hypothetical protein